MIGQIRQKLRNDGLSGLVSTVFREVTAGRLACWPGIRDTLKGCAGLEVGGPSRIFGRLGRFPVYALAGNIDNCNFGSRTVWEGSIDEGESFVFDKRRRPGKQYIAEATNLALLPSESYDVVLSSHVLEHCANPLKALSEWIRVLKKNGHLVLVLPHKDGTFDHARPVTKIEHLIQDFDQGVDEGDLTHLDEILRLHDLSKDPDSGEPQVFRERCLANFENRCFHHHVFDTRLAIQVVHHMKMQILAVQSFLPYNIFVLARKPADGETVGNNAFFLDTNVSAWKSPFASDLAPASQPRA